MVMSLPQWPSLAMVDEYSNVLWETRQISKTRQVCSPTICGYTLVLQ